MSEETLLPLARLMADVLRLPVQEEWWPGVTANLAMGLAMAALVDDFPLPDEAEPAAVYEV